MNEHVIPTDLQETLRQLVFANQQIAHSLAELHKLYAEELLRREAERKELAAERAEWKEREKRATAELDRPHRMPPLPWHLQLFWLLLTLMVTLVILVLGWHLFEAVRVGGIP